MSGGVLVDDGFLLDENFNPLYFRSHGSLWSALTICDDNDSDEEVSNESPFNRKWSSSSSAGSVKKKFVQKILSPILKSTSLEENIGGSRASNSMELHSSPVLGVVSPLLNGGLPQSLIDIDATTFAKEITLIDKELFVRILWHELETCGWMTKDKYVRSPDVMEMVEFFNRIAMLVASEILAEETTQARARVVSKVIQIADKCRLLGNYNSLKALMAGLQSAPIYRLKQTWKEVSSKRRKKFRHLSIIMGESDNFALYRGELSSCLANGPCLPFLGDFLTQIAQTQAYLTVKRKTQGMSTPPTSPTDETPHENSLTNGETTPGNHVTSPDQSVSCPTTPREVSIRSCPTTPVEVSPDASRDMTPVTCSSLLSRDRSSRRSGSARSKFKRLYSRQFSVDTGIMRHSRNNSADMMDVQSVPGFHGKLMPASSDSVLGSERVRTPGSRPPLLRRLSESASMSTPTGLSGKQPKRRLSESGKPGKTRRFLDGFVRRSTSSNSVKEGRFGRCSERLGHSFSTQSIREGNCMTNDTLGKSVSTPVIKDSLSRDVSCHTSQEILDEVERRESVISGDAYQAGTESQLLQYQMAAVQYDFMSCHEVRQYLLNASFNAEEENYRLSLKREPPAKP
ncbi:predicted protein [Nematostella vectensis]|uniref:Ras-GEF domain-containing protein n=1 Tax=Nematostella vectensis TaxID=45351 RepID=A7SLX0_NEMVE|nr:predicted protein [Nematostella vectensis]|eukprot:XP_001627431.1 predicted protein [Nematostella vectensis]